MFVKAQYLCPLQVDNNWYLNEQPKHHITTVPISTILYPQLEVNAVTNVHAIPTSVCTRIQAKKSLPRQPVCLTHSDYDCILKEIGRRDKIEFEIDVEFYSADEGN